MELLAVKIEQIMENLMGFAKDLVQKQEYVDNEILLAYYCPDDLRPLITGQSLHEELAETAPAQEE